VKERLTGAIILVALIVLLVPEVLTGPIRSAPHTAAVTPSGEGAPLRSYTINLSDEAHPRNAASGGTAPESPAPLETAPAAPAAPPPVEAAPPPQPSAPPPAKRVATPATAAPASSGESRSGGWVVQLGSFAQHANAERLAREVRARGFRVSVSQEGSGRRLYRVRVGPAQDRAAATQLAAQLHAAGHSGAIVPK
jgi:DedD protein